MNRSFAFATLLVLASLASAQSRFSTVIYAAGNAARYGYGFDYSGTGAPLALSASESWTGLDSLDQTQTMTFGGTATAQSGFGTLRTSVDATLSNVVYRNGNPAYFDGTPGELPNDEGVPEYLTGVGTAGFTDRLNYADTSDPLHRAVFRFHIDGTAEGAGVNANLRVTIGTNPFEQLDLNLSSGTVDEYWETSAYVIGTSFQQNVQVQFTTRYDAFTGDFSEGADDAGKALFQSTVTLDAVLLYDQNDRLVTGYTVTGDSGTGYRSTPVPEPTTMAALGLGALGMLRRRKRA